MTDEFVDGDGNIIRTAENHIVWRNRQWVIFEDGCLSARHMSYHLTANRLPALNRKYSWHEHLARKNWVDQPLFWQAFRKACEMNKVSITPEELDHWEELALAYLADAPQSSRGPRYDEQPDAYYGHWA